MTVKSNPRSALFLLLTLLLFISGCWKMKLDIQDSKDRIDTLEGSSIPTIDEQISAIVTSIDTLERMDEALESYIKNLEATYAVLQKQINDVNAEITKVKSELGEEISALEQSLLNELNTAKETILEELTVINNTLDDLATADSALDKKIAELQTYIDTEISSTKDWADATFSTLAQYEQTQTEISSIKSSIEQINADIEALEINLNGKIADDIKTAVDALRTELSADYISRIESAVINVTSAYSEAISSAKSEITSAYTESLSSAIEKSESNLKTWVGEQLAQGYYDIATLDGILSALSSKLDETDADLQKQITEQKTSLETVKDELTKAYQSAIKEAIEENNGVISASIAEAVQNLEDKIQARLTVIDTNITNIQKEIANISKDIASVFEQIAGITSSVSDLKEVDRELDEYVKSLENELASLREEFESLKPVDEPTKNALEQDIATLKALIQALEAKDNELEDLIKALQAYADTELQKATDWAEATFATLEQYSAVQTEISAIKTLINKTKEEITKEYTTAIETALSNCETDMKAWVNTLLAQGYYDIAAIDGKMSALEAIVSDSDSDLQKQINELKEALLTAKNELTAAYKTAIEQAINGNNGIIDASITTAVRNLEDKIVTRLAVIESNISNIQKEIANIREDIASIIEQMDGITSSVSDLNEVDKELDDYIRNLENELESLMDEFESFKDVDESEKNKLEQDITDLKALIQALQAKDSELEALIENLKTYTDTELQNTTDWAETTFATLEQYSVIQTEIAAIKVLINKTKEDITEEYTIAIETAISNCEADMKAWVNTQLAQGYYNIAAIDGKVSALETLISDGDSNLQKQINEQKSALQQAKSDLTKEYKQYIDQAIAAGGIIDQAISAQVKTAQDNLQAKIDVINGRLDSLEDRLGKLEEDFVNRIQSLKYIPEYSDRKVEMKGSERVVSLDFQVSPSNQAEKIEIAWQKNYGVVHGGLRVVKNPETRSINPYIALNVISVTGKSDGVLSIVLNADNVNGIDDEFLAGISNGVISVRISDGNNDIFSDWIDVSCIDLNVFEDLSPLKNGIYETANCYIVSKPGLYKFKAYRGNSQDLAGALSADELPEGVPVSANVLWESFGTSTYILSEELIDYVRYFDEYIVFRKTNNTETGNALIAATNKDNMPLWSWHIWMTENPVEQEYYNDAGIMMDRNLGATSAIPGDQSAIGLLYQKGRKDPFVPKTNMTSTIIWPGLSNKKSVPIREAVVNPITEYVSFYQPNQWQSSKTIYDPCPAGYRVPDGGNSGIWKTAIGETSCKYECYDKTNKGANLGGVLGEDSIIWYPSTEYIDGSTYTKDYSIGLYWSTHEYGLGIHDTYLSISSHNYTIQSAYTYWSNVRLCAVRCQKE